MPSQHLHKVLVVGAGGTNIGHHIAKALSLDSSFELSILSRAGSKSTYPPNAKVITIPDNTTHDDYVRTLRGQDAVVSALGFEGKPTEKALIDAAIEAGVKRFLPSEYGVDNTNPATSGLSPVFRRKADIIEYLKSKEATGLTWTAVPTGMWLDWYALAASVLSLRVDFTD
jgi:saccharopine dehydrogenase-like NADP-dependent oxidoreductase